MNPEDWEDICTKCGKCCYEKVDLGGGEIRYTDEPCQYLNIETNLCEIYHERHEVEPDCISLTEELVRTLGWLPEDCAYLEHVRYKDTVTAVREAQSKGNKKRRGNNKRRRPCP